MKNQLSFANLQALMRRTQPQFKPISKPLLLVLLSLSAVLVIFMRIPTHFEASDFIIDASWFIELENQLRMGHLLGRDVHFTYGLLAQVLAWMASFIRTNDSPLYGYAIGNAFFEVVAVGVLALSLGLIRQIRASGTLFIFSMYVVLNSVLFLRPLIGVLSTIVLVRALEAPLARRRGISVLVGLLWFAGQLVTVELGVYAILAATGLLGLCAALALPQLRRWTSSLQLLPAWSYIEVLLISLATIVLANIGIEIFYRLSSSVYTDFEYLKFSFALMRGYSYTMGLDWNVDSPITTILLIVFIYTVIAVCIHMRQAERGVFYLLSGLSITAILSLKSAFVRSDPLHVFQAIDTLILLFLITIHLFQSEFLFKLTGYTILTIFTVLVILYSPAIYLNLKQSTLNGRNILSQWGDVQKTTIDTSSVISNSFKNAINPRKMMLNFPFDNYIAIASDQRSLAPVLQTYAAFNEEMQEQYNRAVGIYKDDTEIVYGMDNLTSFQIGGVQTVTRTPVIFKYIYENFKLKSEQIFGDGYIVLAPRQQPQPVATTALPYDVQAGADGVNIVLRQPATCGLLQMDVTMHYPLAATVGRPNQPTLRVYHGDQLLAKNNLVAIETARPFSTFFYLGPAERFYQLFSDARGADVKVTFDRITLTPGQHDLLGVNPDQLAIANLRCVQ